MPAKTIKLADEAGFLFECFGGGEESGIVCSPKTAGAAEGREAGGGGETWAC